MQKLTDARIRKTISDKGGQPASGYKIADGGGLFLFVTPAGSKIWRVRYRVNGKEQVTVIGPYPAISLAEARDKLADVRRLLRAGTTPKQVKAKVDESHATLQAVAKRWFDRHAAEVDPRNARAMWDSLTADVCTAKPDGSRMSLGDMQINDINVPMVVNVLRRVEGRGALTIAHRHRTKLALIFEFAMAEGLCTQNPAAACAKSLRRRKRTINRPAVDTAEKAREVLRQSEDSPAHPGTHLAIRMQALTCLRSGKELLGGQWDELHDLDGPQPTWIVPKERMKGQKQEHAVPLSRQAVETLKVAQRLYGNHRLIFPGIWDRERPLNVATLSSHMLGAGLGGKMVPHGWRATFLTVMKEREPLDLPVLDMMLAHKPKDVLKGAYDRAVLASRRRELAQIWADLLMDGMPPPDTLINQRWN